MAQFSTRLAPAVWISKGSKFCLRSVLKSCRTSHRTCAQRVLLTSQVKWGVEYCTTSPIHMELVFLQKAGVCVRERDVYPLYPLYILLLVSLHSALLFCFPLCKQATLQALYCTRTETFESKTVQADCWRLLDTSPYILSGHAQHHDQTCASVYNQYGPFFFLFCLCPFEGAQNSAGHCLKPRCLQRYSPSCRASCPPCRSLQWELSSLRPPSHVRQLFQSCEKK